MSLTKSIIELRRMHSTFLAEDFAAQLTESGPESPPPQSRREFLDQRHPGNPGWINGAFPSGMITPFGMWRARTESGRGIPHGTISMDFEPDHELRHNHGVFPERIWFQNQQDAHAWAGSVHDGHVLELAQSIVQSHHPTHPTERMPVNMEFNGGHRIREIANQTLARRAELEAIDPDMGAGVDFFHAAAHHAADAFDVLHDLTSDALPNSKPHPAHAAIHREAVQALADASRAHTWIRDAWSQRQWIPGY